MHRAPVPHPDHEPMEEDDSIPVPGVPAPDDDPVPDHNPQLCATVQENPMTEQAPRSGAHIARADNRLMPDGTFESQVFVRLGQPSALGAAQEQARRALEEHAF